MHRRFSSQNFRLTDDWRFFKAILLGRDFKIVRKMEIFKLKTFANCVTVFVILSAILSSNIINCDQPVNSTSNQTSTLAMQNSSQTIPQTITTTTSKSTSATITTTSLPIQITTKTLNKTSSSNVASIKNQSTFARDYKQHPNPASQDSSTKISYDMQHEQQVTTLASPANSMSTSDAIQTPSIQYDSTNSSNSSASTSPLSRKSSIAENDQKDISEVVSNATTIERKTHVDNGDSSYSSSMGESNVGEQSLVSGSKSAGDFLIAVDSAALPTSSALDDATLDLDSSTGPSVISRHGRASLSGNSYTPPASSRLSHYSPGMLLQNSRAHPRAEQQNSPSEQNGQNNQHLTTITTTSSPSSSFIQQYQPKPNAPFDPIIVCYLGSWSVYRPGLAKFTPENINPFLCTHIIYAFAGISSKYELRPFDSYNDITQGGYRKFTSLKDYNKQLKTLIAVGGWNEGSARFSKLVASPELRANFIQSTIRFLREHKFDGIDLDWEYPSYRDGSSPDDKERYATLIKELRVAFDKDKENHPNSQKLLLSVAVPAGQDNIDNGFDVPTISKNVDFMNVLTYDYYTAFDKQTNHHAPLSIRDTSLVDASSRRLNIDWTINYYLSLGAAPNKLVLGVPTYGRSYTLSSALNVDEKSQLNGNEDSLELADKIGLGARADSPGEEGPATREKGYLAYYEICQKIDNEQWHKRKFASDHQGPIAFKGNQWVSYDDIDSAILKTQYVIKNRLGGLMVWTLDNDDFRGSCPSSRQQENPLITAIRDTLIKSIGASKPNQVNKPTTTSTTTTTTTTSTTTTPAPPTETEEDVNELATSSSAESASASEASSSLIRNLANGARQAPTTPDPGAAFSCKDEGFFPNPKDCKKYFWCLDSGPANLGVVAHAFTCPSGLFFNSQTEGCDYPEKVSCKQSRSTTTTVTPKTTSTTTSTTHAPPAARQASNPQTSSSDRSRMVVKKSRKPSSTTTTTTTSTTTTTTPAPTTTQVPKTTIPSIPITNDINELVASMLQNPAFASVISNQLKLGGAGGSNSINNQQVQRPQSSGAIDSGTNDFGTSMTSESSDQNPELPSNQQESNNSANSKQAQDLLQLLNSIQSLGGVDKIIPFLSSQTGGNGLDMSSAKLNELAANNRIVRNDSLFIPEDGGMSDNRLIQDTLVTNSGGNTRQRRPQKTDLNYQSYTRPTTLIENENSSPTGPFVFSYGQPNNGDQRNVDSTTNQQFDSNSNQLDNSSGVQPTLTPEIMSNLAQLESLFAYNQPGRQQVGNSAQPPSFVTTQATLRQPNVESVPFTVDDAKFHPIMPMQPSQTGQRQQETIIRVQIPDQRGNQHRQGRPASQQRQQQAHSPTYRNQQHFNDINNFLPYLEGDVRQPVGQRLSAQQPQQTQRGNPQRLQPSNSQAVASNTRQQFVSQPPPLQTVGSVDDNQDRVMKQQWKSQQPVTRSNQVQQQRRRPPNRERNQRVNSADFPTSTSGTLQGSSNFVRGDQDRPRSLVLLTSGPPTIQADPLTSSDTPSSSDETLTDKALEERLRLLENGYLSGTPTIEPAATTNQKNLRNNNNIIHDDSNTDANMNSNTRQQFNNGFFYQPTLSSTNVVSSSSQTNSQHSEVRPTTTTISTLASTSTSTGFSRDLPTGRVNMENDDSSSSSSSLNGSSESNSSPNDPNNQLSAPALLDQSGPGASLDPQTGKLVCNRRGVFAHPNSCGQFIVCAPQSRSQRSLRPFEHHCPAEHIFHDSWGRCRPKSLQSDLGKLCHISG